MGCTNCGKRKYSRYGGNPVLEEQDSEKYHPTPYSAFLQATGLTYEDFEERRLKQKELMDEQSETVLSQMSDAMRRFHVEELIRIINFESANPMGLVPGTAVRTLHKILAREDFQFISDIYPNLRDQIDKRYSLLEEQTIELKTVK